MTMESSRSELVRRFGGAAAEDGKEEKKNRNKLENRFTLLYYSKSTSLRRGVLFLGGALLNNIIKAGVHKSGAQLPSTRFGHRRGKTDTKPGKSTLLQHFAKYL